MRILAICLFLAFAFNSSVLFGQSFEPRFFAFENGLGGLSTEQRVELLKRLGFDGIGSANPRNLSQRIPQYEQAGLKIYSLYVGGRVDREGAHYDPQISTAIKELKDSETMIELYVQGGPGADDQQAVAFVREIADQAQNSNLRVVLYPHTGFYIDTLEDAVRVAKLADRKNVGVMFNLCHHLMVQPNVEIAQSLSSAKAYLWRVSVCGADREGRSWQKLIQPLSAGDFDQVELLQTLKKVGFEGAVGLQCFAIPLPPAEHLGESIKAWHANLASRRD